ncbi:hypothetical protein [Adlercreutzia mucosicola]|uniref:hypothetical protein n=1 Tax=Adlercreutzia mucosicola TaxID=580026 RepID=UPI0003FDE4A4|nr:hypothetical protein [Adlercreutzia mucosicola]MCR2034798.1 hypothetical protein [Adlercreutzia mucosicola]
MAENEHMERAVEPETLVEALVERDAAAREARARQDLRQQRARELMTVLDAVKSRAQNERERRARRAARAVECMCQDVEQDALGRLARDPRTPQTINYRQRYRAFLHMEDRGQLFARLEQTLDLADRILGLVPKLDVDAAFRETARAIAACIELRVGKAPVPSLEEERPAASEEGALGGISEGGEDRAAFPSGCAAGSAGEGCGLDRLLDRAFAAASIAEDGAAGLLASESEFEDAKRALEEELDGVAADEEMRGAQQAVGAVIDVSGFPAFNGSATLEVKYSPDELSALSSLVRVSFETFKRVVQDHGLFAAFAADGAFGSCSYDPWWSTGWLDDQRVDLLSVLGRDEDAGRDIPVTFEEDKGGDAPARAIERMKEFNAKPFYGMLDDNFAFHTEAFWYGFRKLMEYINDLCKVDTGDFCEYLEDLNAFIAGEAEQLGLRMSDKQLAEWCEALQDAS